MGKSNFGSKTLLIFVSLFIIGCGTSNTPEGAYKKYNKAAAAGDCEALYESLTKASTSGLEKMLKSLASRSEAMSRSTESVPDSRRRAMPVILNEGDIKTMKSMMNLTGKEFFIIASRELVKVNDYFKNSSGSYEVIDVVIREDRARLSVTRNNRPKEAAMVQRIDGLWKVVLNPGALMRPDRSQAGMSKRMEKKN